MAKRACIVRHYTYELLVRREAEALCSAGFEVDVICLSASSHGSEEIENGVHVYRLPVTRKKGSIARYVFDYLSFFLLVALKLTVLHLRHPYAVIQVNNMPDFLVFATLIPRLSGAKATLVMYEPTPELWATKYNALCLIKPLEIIEQLSLRYAHAVFAVTQQLKEVLVARGASADKITVMLNVPDARFFEQALDNAPRGDGHFTLICHGAVEERYGHDTILQAVARVKSHIPNLRLRILGGGSYLNEFLAQVEAMGLEDYVQYLGWVPRAQMVEELRNADVGIVAQKSSPYSNLVHTGKMYDYLACGKPVLASRLKSVRAYFDEDCLYFFEPGDPESLAAGILDLYQCPARRQTLINNSRRLYDLYKWDKQKIAYLAVYHSLVGLNYPP